MKKYSWWLSVIILIALALRLYNLTYHSLWFDEAVSVHWAKQSVPRILEVGFTLVEDRLPPLYYLMLKGWTSLFGSGEAALRGLSVVFGVLLVPVSAGTAALLFSRRVALISAALVALNPFLIWYAQEARMYASAVLFSTLTIWAFLQACRSANHKRQAVDAIRAPAGQTVATLQISPAVTYGYLLLFFVSATAALYSHLYAGFLLPALGLWLVISYPRAWRLWLVFAICGLIVSLAYAPIILAIWRFSSETPPGSPLTGLVQRLWWLLQSFTIWKAPLPAMLRIVVPGAIIVFAALAYLKPTVTHYRRTYSRSISNPRLLVTLLFIIPFIIATLLLFRNHLAFFGERYFIVMLPWLLMLSAAGTDTFTQWLESRFGRGDANRAGAPMSFPAAIILLFITAIPIPGQWSIPAAKESWRQSVAYLAENAAADHAILIHPDWVRFPFQYYFQGPGQTYAVFSTVTDSTELDGPLQGVVSDHQIIWLIQSHLDAPDPDRLVERWLAARYPLVTELYPPGVTLKGYAPGYRLDVLPRAAMPVELEFENGMQLVGFQADQSISATDELFHPPSGWVHVTLYWRADRPVSADAAPFVHLIGPEGIWGVNLERSGDALKLYPPSRWFESGSIIRHDLDINLNPATPPGIYQLVVGLPNQQAQYPFGQVEIR